MSRYFQDNEQNVYRKETRRVILGSGGGEIKCLFVQESLVKAGAGRVQSIYANNGRSFAKKLDPS